MMPTSKLQRYTEAIRLLEESSANLDEAITELRLAEVDQPCLDHRTIYSPTPERLMHSADAMAKALTDNRCDDCGALVMAHGPDLQCDPSVKAAFENDGACATDEPAGNDAPVPPIVQPEKKGSL